MPEEVVPVTARDANLRFRTTLREWAESFRIELVRQYAAEQLSPKANTVRQRHMPSPQPGHDKHRGPK